MKLKKFNEKLESKKLLNQHNKENKIKKRTIVLSIVIFIIGIIYITYASFNTTAKINVMHAKVGRINKSDLDLIAYVDGQLAEDIPAKNEGYYILNVECDNNATAVWNSEDWNITVSNLSKSGTSCILNFLSFNPVQDFSYKNQVQPYTIGVDGIYKIELWGASGSSHLKDNGTPLQYGAYTSGEIELNKDEVLYFYTGQRGAYCGPFTSYNGGGTLQINGCGDNNNGAGGGATDVRYFESTPSSSDLVWNSELGLNSRIMVAAGAGSGTAWASGQFAGGGLSSFDVSHAGSGYTAQAATQTSGNAFGIGGSANRGSGGGGYWGGKANYLVGSGGSSFISGYTGCVAIESSSSRLARKGTNGGTCANGTTDKKCSEHFSGKVFNNAVMKAGNEVMPSHDGTSTMTGNEDNGYAKITLVSLT